MKKNNIILTTVFTTLFLFSAIAQDKPPKALHRIYFHKVSINNTKWKGDMEIRQAFDIILEFKAQGNETHTTKRGFTGNTIGVPLI